MALRKYKLGELISVSDEKNTNNKYTISDVKGISNKKMFIETKADMTGVSLTPYLLVKPDFFAYVPTTSRNGNKITIAYNSTEDTYIVSSSYIIFYVKDKSILLSDYLFMYFNRPEFDRYARFNSWGSARETFDWSEMCDIDIELPPIEIQQKYVNVYKAMVANQKSYEKGLDGLKLVCDAYIEDLRRKYPCEEIGQYLELVTDNNSELSLTKNDVLGISKEKKTIPTKASVSKSDLPKFTIVKYNDFIYNPRNGVAIGLNKNKKNKLISFNNTAFHIKEEYKIILSPDYLFLFFKRNEWDRKVKIDSWGSSTEVYAFKELCETKIPMVDISIQKSIANIGLVLEQRKEINEKLKAQIKDLCPILIAGAIQEAKKEA